MAVEPDMLEISLDHFYEYFVMKENNIENDNANVDYDNNINDHIIKLNQLREKDRC